jgi:hypothetical protein
MCSNVPYKAVDERDVFNRQGCGVPRGSAEIGFEMILAHKIAPDPKPAHTTYFRGACGTKRYAYNWGLAQWQRMREVGEKPSMAIVKRRWNAHCKAELPWSYDVTMCASGQAIMDLGAAFANFFRDCEAEEATAFPLSAFHKEVPQREF